MPTNLPPEYYDAEERYREAQTPEEKVTRLEELISTVPKHKGTDHLRADLRRKLSELKKAKKRPKTVSRHESVFHIDREGAGQVAVIGPPNSGKSSLVDALTNATPQVGAYPFTTWEPTPGMMPFENIQIQLIDTPPLSDEHVEPELLDLIRRADLMLLVIDIQDFPIEQLEESIALLRRHNIVPRHQYRQETFERYVSAIPLLVLVNKVDDEACQEDFEVFCELLEGEWPLLPVSLQSGFNVEHLKQTLFEKLEIIRVYSKPPAREADLTAPFVLKRGSTVETFAAKVHQDFVKNLKAARMWGAGVFDGQMVGRDHVLHDGDIVELRT
ncbi:MAG TPA: GTPase [Candidatus Sulfomarinibacteraceae bacterium]|nr:GTPase [Candidatus Sulfomarinibacteraceae bacterium]